MDTQEEIRTLDLVERANFALNAMTRCTNPDAGYAVYLTMRPNRNPPVLCHDVPHDPMPFYGKFMEATALVRRMTESDLNHHVDRAWHDGFMRQLRKERPALGGWNGGRHLAWLAIQYQNTREPEYRELGEHSIQVAVDAAIRRDDYAYFGPGDGTPGGWATTFGTYSPDGTPVSTVTGMPTGWMATFQGWTIQGLVKFHQVTGSEVALDLAGDLARYLAHHAEVFDEDGRIIARHGAQRGLGLPPAVHFHHSGNVMEGLAEYALAAGDEVVMALVLKVYGRARAVGTPLVGFFPEYIDHWPDDRMFIDCEGCCVADMILTALRMTQAGVGDYWDDINRYTRNQFSEMQMTSGEWVDRLAERSLETPVGPGESGVDVAERCVGSFAGWSTANDFYPGAGRGIMHCCTANCSRTLYYLWESMHERTDDGLRVHLLLDRESDLAVVRSRVPHAGRVDIWMKRACRAIEIRAPEWVESGSSAVVCKVNGEPHEGAWEGRYVAVKGIAAGDSVQYGFPMPERTVVETIGAIDYVLRICGNNVVSISPEGTYYPFYQY